MPFVPTAEELEVHFAPFDENNPSAPHGHFRLNSPRVHTYVIGQVQNAYLASKLNRMPTGDEQVSEVRSITGKWEGDDATIAEGTTIDQLIARWKATANLDARGSNVPVQEDRPS